MAKEGLEVLLGIGARALVNVSVFGARKIVVGIPNWTTRGTPTRRTLVTKRHENINVTKTRSRRNFVF